MTFCFNSEQSDWQPMWQIGLDIKCFLRCGLAQRMEIKQNYSWHCMKPKAIKPSQCYCVGLDTEICEVPTVSVSFWPWEMPNLEKSPWQFPKGNVWL